MSSNKVELKKIKLKGGILKPGTKFIVADDIKSSTILPSSLGFVSHMKGHDREHPDVVHMEVVMVRYGKTGKERINKRRITTPAFIKEGEEVKIIEGRKLYVCLNPIIDDHISLLKFSTVDYLGWMKAYSSFLLKIVDRARHATVHMEGDNVFEIIDKACDLFGKDDPESLKLIEKITSEETRKRHIATMRKLESAVTKGRSIYSTLIAETELTIAEGITSDEETLMRLNKNLKNLTDISRT